MRALRPAAAPACATADCIPGHTCRTLDAGIVPGSLIQLGGGKYIPQSHYFGAVAISDPQRQQSGAVPERHLVDGQQRITTFFRMLVLPDARPSGRSSFRTLVTLREVARKADVSRIENVASSYLFNEESNGVPDPDNGEPQG
jgi:hypothetical protein